MQCRVESLNRAFVLVSYATVLCIERERRMHEMSDDAVDVDICVSFENDVVAAGVRLSLMVGYRSVTPHTWLAFGKWYRQRHR